MFNAGVLKSCPSSSISSRSSRTHLLRRRPSAQCFHGLFPPRSKTLNSLPLLRWRRVFSSHRRLSKHRNSHGIPPRTQPDAASNSEKSNPKPSRRTEEPRRQPRHAQFGSSLLKTLIVTKTIMLAPRGTKATFVAMKQRHLRLNRPRREKVAPSVQNSPRD